MPLTSKKEMNNKNDTRDNYKYNKLFILITSIINRFANQDNEKQSPNYKQIKTITYSSIRTER